MAVPIPLVHFLSKAGPSYDGSGTFTGQAPDDWDHSHLASPSTLPSRAYAGDESEEFRASTPTETACRESLSWKGK